MNQSKKEQKKAKQLARQIETSIKKLIDNHNKRMQQLNYQKKFGGQSKKIQQSERNFYTELSQVAQKNKSLDKVLKSSTHLRKQRKAMYEEIVEYLTYALERLINHKENIKIKINQELRQLVPKTAKLIDDSIKNLKNFEKQSESFFGKAYECKPQVQQSLLYLSEYAFLWDNISKFDSVTNDSVKQLFLPLEFSTLEFSIEKQLIKLWPEPKKIEVVKVVNQKVQQIVECKSKLQQAHELLFGFTRSQDVYKAIQIYEAQAYKQPADSSALNALATIYEEGKYLSRDVKKSFNLYMKSAKLGDPEGLYKLGKFLEKGQINTKQNFDGLYPNRQSEVRGAIEHYEKAAAKGHLDALTDLGFVYEKGIMTEDGTQYYIQPHVDHALKYYQKARQRKHPRSYNNLGNLLITSSEIPQEIENSNLEKGLKYLQRSTQLKYPKAFLNLAKCYLNGIGIEPNIQKARSLFLAGSQLGDAQCKLEYLKSYLGQSLEDEKIMIKLVELTRQVLLSDKNNAEALYMMGLFEQKGIGVSSNKQSSYYYINQAARLDYPSAITKLGDYYYSGYFVDRNYDIAQKLYHKAAEKQDSQAILNLGHMIEKGLIQTYNHNSVGEAQQYYKKSAQMGNTNAMLLLGLKKNQGKISTGNQIYQAAENGNHHALKMLNRTQLRMAPKNNEKQKTNYSSALKKLSTFYNKDQGNHFMKSRLKVSDY